MSSNGSQFRGFRVDDIPREDDEVGLLGIDQVHRFLQGFPIPVPATRVDVRNLRNTIPVEGGRKVGRGERDLLDVELFSTPEGPVKYYDDQGYPGDNAYPAKGVNLPFQQVF